MGVCVQYKHSGTFHAQLQQFSTNSKTEEHIGLLNI